MDNKANYFKIGLFVISATAIAIAAVIILGVGALFQDSLEMETYLDESVQGLNVGSPVKHRGVQIGSVDEITFVQNKYKLDPRVENYDKYTRYVLVKMNITTLLAGMSAKEKQNEIRRQINNGLRIRLASQGLTGTAYMELDYLPPDKNPMPTIAWEPQSIYLPSAPSTITRISSAVDRFFDNLDKAEVLKITGNLDQLLVALTASIRAARLGEVSSEAIAMFSELRKTNSELQTLVAARGFQNAPDNLNKSLLQLSRTMRRLDHILAGNQGDITEAVQNLKTATEELKGITDNARRYPSMIMFGDPPSRSSLEKPK